MLMPVFEENLLDNFFEHFARPTRNMTRYGVPTSNLMRTDVKEMENGYELAVEMPGYKKEDITAELKDGYLIIQASMDKSEDEKDKNGKYIRRERYSGSCSRTFYVGKHLKQEDMKARFEDGILKVMVSKKEKETVEEKNYIAIEG